MMPTATYYFGKGYRYGFQGQEKDDEVKGAGNSYDFGERIQDPRLGRFLSVDRLFGKFPFYSPYQFAGNSPLSFIDLDGLEPESMISKNGKLTKPVISLLNAAFDFDEEFLLTTTWKGVDKVNVMNSNAMTVYDEVRYKNSLNDNEIKYDDAYWLGLIAHEQKHRDDIGNNTVAATIWYASYGLNYILGGFSYRDNEDEKRAFKYGLSSNGSLMDRLLSEKGKEMIAILDSKLTPDEKANKLKIIGLEFKLSLLKEKLQMTEAIFGNSIEEVKAKIIDPITRQINVVSGAINSAKINAVKSSETNNTTENSTNSDTSVKQQVETTTGKKAISSSNNSQNTKPKSANKSKSSGGSKKTTPKARFD